jgi:hypothetical protein
MPEHFEFLVVFSVDEACPAVISARELSSYDSLETGVEAELGCGAVGVSA